MGKEAYWTLNSAKPSDEELDSSIDRIVSGLFSVSVTMGSIPIIRCPPGTAAQAIAAKLDRKVSLLYISHAVSDSMGNSSFTF
jgi:hypothetical protein